MTGAGNEASDLSWRLRRLSTGFLRAWKNFEPLTEAMREWPLNDMPNEVESMLRALTTEIEFVDLTLSLREAAARGGLTYLPDDTHWAAERQRVAGEAIHHLLAGRPTRLAKQ